MSSTTDPILPLELLAAGQKADVYQLVGSSADVHRLEELGLRAGATIEMVSPGSPCIIRLSGHKLCFRDGEALGVLVRPGAFE